MPRGIRKVVTERQMLAAKLVVDGLSWYRALTQAGYTPSTAKCPTALLTGSWGLREALRREQESRQKRFLARPIRKYDRYDRRSATKLIQDYVNVGTDDSNRMHGEYLKEQTTARRVVGLARPGTIPRVVLCSVCRGRTEGNDHWCPRCERLER